jgi:hypothetical protein
MVLASKSPNASAKRVRLELAPSGAQAGPAPVAARKFRLFFHLVQVIWNERKDRTSLRAFYSPRTFVEMMTKRLKRQEIAI